MVELINNPATFKRQVEEHPFYFDPVIDYYYNPLLAYIEPKLDAMYGTDWRNLGTWDKSVKLRNFVRRWGDKGWHARPRTYTGAAYTTELRQIQPIIDWHEAGNEGMCSWYSTFYMHCCVALGIQCRTVNWRSPVEGGDVVTEVWNPDIRKWVMVAPLFNRWYTDANGVPMSIVDIHETFHFGDLTTLIPQFDGYIDDSADWDMHQLYLDRWTAEEYATYDLWILEHAYAIAVYMSNGQGYTNGKYPHMYYSDPTPAVFNEVEPYLLGIGVPQVYSDKNVFYFDIDVVKLAEPTFVGRNLRITIADYLAANLETFKWRLKQTGGATISEGAFTTLSTDVPLPVAQGDYELFVFTVNDRGGEGAMPSVLMTLEESAISSTVQARVRYWNGEQYVDGQLKAWNGTEWVAHNPLVFKT